MNEPDWSHFRSQIPALPGKINLNAGTLSPTPLPVLSATHDLRQLMAANGTNFFWRALPPRLQKSRETLASFLGCDPLDLLLFQNVTVALNSVIASLPLDAGDEIVLTDAEYGAMQLAWRRRAEASRLKLKVVELPATPADPQQIADVFAAAISDRTRVVFFSHVTSPTGLILPAANIARLARERDIIVVIDGAHAPGMIDVNLDAIDADFYAANCHKWIMGAPGAGFCRVARRSRDKLRPLVTSWGYEYDADDADADSGWGGSMWQRSFEYIGLYDRCAQGTLDVAIEFGDAIGRANIASRVRELSHHARDKLGEIGLTCRSPDDTRLTGGMLAFDFPPIEHARWRNTLWERFGIECPVSNIGDRHFLRVSTAWFNTEDEIDRLAAAVKVLRDENVFA